MSESARIAAELLDLERRGWDALCASTGAAFYGQIMTDDGLMVLAGGFTLDRDGVVASLADAPAWDSVDISDYRVIRVSDDAWILVYGARATRGAEPEFRALMSSSYVRMSGEWRLALYQQTPVEA